VKIGQKDSQPQQTKNEREGGDTDNLKNGHSETFQRSAKKKQGQREWGKKMFGHRLGEQGSEKGEAERGGYGGGAQRPFG